MSQTDWQQLPNAAWIRWLEQHAKTHPQVLEQAWDGLWHYRGDDGWVEGCQALARDGQDRRQYWNQAWNWVWDRTTNEIPSQAVANVLLALIAYDDAGSMMGMTYEQLLVWAEVSDHAAARLLLPAVMARELAAELELCDADK